MWLWLMIFSREQPKSHCSDNLRAFRYVGIVCYWLAGKPCYEQMIRAHNASFSLVGNQWLGSADSWHFPLEKGPVQRPSNVVQRPSNARFFWVLDAWNGSRSGFRWYVQHVQHVQQRFLCTHYKKYLNTSVQVKNLPLFLEKISLFRETSKNRWFSLLTIQVQIF